jgi:hypothetical protein
VALGLALRGVATAAADISDGLVGDLGHILKASRVGASIDTSIAINLIANRGHLTLGNGQFDAETALECVLAGGDDYELVFTSPSSARSRSRRRAAQTPVTASARSKLRRSFAWWIRGELVTRRRSFDHFAERAASRHDRAGAVLDRRPPHPRDLPRASCVRTRRMRSPASDGLSPVAPGTPARCGPAGPVMLGLWLNPMQLAC